jgi:hypothetical protein
MASHKKASARHHSPFRLAVTALTVAALTLVSGGLLVTQASAQAAGTPPDVTAADRSYPASDGGEASAERSDDAQVDKTKGDPAVETDTVATVGLRAVAESLPDEPADVVPGDPASAPTDRGPPAAVNGATITVRTAVPGVELGLYTEQADGSRLTHEWATATSETTDAGHEAVFTVPIRTGGSNTITSGGVPAKQQLWVRAAEAPQGYSVPAELGVGPLTEKVQGTNPDRHRLRPYSVQTPELQANGTYVSGTHFMNRSTKSGTTDARYEGSTGTWAVVQDNPEMPASCAGLNVAVVLDFSASVSDTQAKQVKQVASAYVDALAGTPSAMEVFPFGTTALTASGTHSLTTQENVDALKTYIEDFARPEAAQYTNWDAALRAIPASKFQVIVVVTDGMPTVYGTGSTSDGSGVTRFAEMEAAIAAANTHKGAGTHLKAFGVGNGIESDAALANLQAIASPDAVTRTQNYEQVAAELRAQVLKDCTPSVSVTKLVEPWNFGAPGVTRAPAAGWEFKADVLGMEHREGEATQVTPEGGGVMWRLEAATTGDRATVTVTEKQQPGFQLAPQGQRNAQCVVKNASTPVAGESLAVTDTQDGFVIDGIATGDMVTCTVINKELPPLAIDSVTVTGSAHVDYDWAIAKSVSPGTPQETTPGVDVEFGYGLRVTASRQDGPVAVTGTVTVSNPDQSVAIPVDSVKVSVAGKPVTLDSDAAATVPAGETVDLAFTAELTGVSEDVPVTVTAPGRAPLTTWLAPSDIELTESDRLAAVTDTFPEFAAAHPDPVTLDAEEVIAEDGVTFEYTASRGADVPSDGGEETFLNVATVHPDGPDPMSPPAEGWEDDQDPGDLSDEETVTVRTPPLYDLALRMWVAEVWHGTVQLFERQSDPSDSGPNNPIPHATFDHDDFDIEVGDLIVHDVHVFNQGNRTARVDELVSYRATGLELAGDELLAGAVGHDNTGWVPSSDGLGNLSFPDAGIVLAPGESAEVTLTLVVTEDAMSDDGEAAERFTFAEIAAFSGWAPLHGATAARPFTLTGLLGSLLYDGVPGYWSNTVDDVDSVPDRENGGTDVDNATLVYHSWEDNEIYESNTSMAWDTGDDDFDNDEDDHDGAIIRVYTAGTREARQSAGDPSPEALTTPDTSTDNPSTGNSSTDDAPITEAQPALRTSTGGLVSQLGDVRWAALAAAAILATTAGVLLLVRRREPATQMRHRR